MPFLIFIMPPDSRMFHSKYFFSVWFGRFFLVGGNCDNWECLDLSAQDSIVIYAKANSHGKIIQTSCNPLNNGHV